MFERYTEEARRCLFFARYEASVFGDAEIDPEHLLLGILRQDPGLAQRLFPAEMTPEAIRTQIERDRPVRQKVATSVDLPIGHFAKRVLAYGAEEAERWGGQPIRVMHLLLGVLREKDCQASRILREGGVTLENLRLAAHSDPPLAGRLEQYVPKSEPERRPAQPSEPEFFRDLTEAAGRGELTPLIGRESELKRSIQILSRRTKNNVALIGEPGAGKTAIVEGLAQRIADGEIPGLSECRVLLADALSCFPLDPAKTSRIQPYAALDRLALKGDLLFCFEGLFDLAEERSGWSLIEGLLVLESHFAGGTVRCIATGTPEGFRRTLTQAPALARYLEAVDVATPDAEEAVKVLQGLQAGYEQFHGVQFGDGTIAMAVYASGRFLAHRCLPDRALDLLDEAGALVSMRTQTNPPGAAVLRGRIRKHVVDRERAITRHDLTEVRQLWEAEVAERENLRQFLEHHALADPPDKTVTPADVELVVADRTGVPVSAVQAILRQKGPGELERVIAQLGKAIAVEGNEWVALLAAYIVRSGPEDTAALADAIRAAKAE